MPLLRLLRPGRPVADSRLTPPPLGLLACAGRLPIMVAQAAQQTGWPVVCIAAAGMADPELRRYCDQFHWLRRSSLGFIVRIFRRAGVRYWTMAGKFHKHLLFHPWRWLYFLPDWRFVRFYFFRKRPANNDDSLLLGLIAELRSEGLECMSPLEVCPELLAPEGVLTRRAPTAAEWRDIAYGWHLAREMGRLDVGQSVMVRERAVLAVEAIEGTDQAIERAGRLAGQRGFVVVKVAKPQQDLRFDVPTVGLHTIQTLARAGGRVLAIEAGRTILLDKEAAISLANDRRISIVALRQPPDPEATPAAVGDDFGLLDD